MNKNKNKTTWKNIILLIILLIFICGLVYSSINIIKWHKDNKNTEEITKKIEELVEVEEVEDNEFTEIIEIPEEKKEEIPKSNPYWDYIKIPLINVNFRELKELNNDTVGWIQVNGSNINYPFVQTNNNDFYLNHSYDKTFNYAGWVFLDYRNQINNLDQNTILYAHGRLDTTMFGSLRNIFTNNWLKNPNNYVIRLSTEYENTLWQVFSVYRIPTTNDYMRIEFFNNEDFLEFANMLIERSSHNFNTTISENDKILTLSTCYDTEDKVVMHAKLIKKESKQLV